MSDNLSKEIEVLNSIRKKIEEDGDSHLFTDLDTPISKNAFELSDQEKIERIEEYFTQIMLTLGLDLTDDRTDPRKGIRLNYENYGFEGEGLTNYRVEDYSLTTFLPNEKF